MAKQFAYFTDETDRVVLRHAMPETLPNNRKEAAALVINQSEVPELPITAEDEVVDTFIRGGKVEYETRKVELPEEEG